LTGSSFLESFVKIFSGKKLDPGCIVEQLFMEAVALPYELLCNDLATRQHLLDLLNCLGGLESASISSAVDPSTKGFRALTKLSLKPVACATNLFFETRLTLRKEALEKFDPQNPHILGLLRSSPFSVKLFGSAEAKELITSARGLSKPLFLLGFSGSHKRPPTPLAGKRFKRAF